MTRALLECCATSRSKWYARHRLAFPTTSLHPHTLAKSGRDKRCNLCASYVTCSSWAGRLANGSVSTVMPFSLLGSIGNENCAQAFLLVTLASRLPRDVHLPLPFTRSSQPPESHVLHCFQPYLSGGNALMRILPHMTEVLNIGRFCDGKGHLDSGWPQHDHQCQHGLRAR